MDCGDGMYVSVVQVLLEIVDTFNNILVHLV